MNQTHAAVVGGLRLKGFPPQFSAKGKERFPTPRINTAFILVSDICAASYILFTFHSVMESRKRPHSTEDEPIIQKKRVLTSVNGTPHVNGVVSDTEEPKEQDNLEVRLYRRFKGISNNQAP